MHPYDVADKWLTDNKLLSSYFQMLANKPRSNLTRQLLILTQLAVLHEQLGQMVWIWAVLLRNDPFSKSGF